MTAILGLVGNICLAANGFFVLEPDALIHTSGCDAAMVRSARFLAEEIVAGDGDEIRPGSILKIQFTVDEPQAKSVLESKRWGVEHRVRFGSDPYWTDLLWHAKKGETRRIVFLDDNGNLRSTVVVTIG